MRQRTTAVVSLAVGFLMELCGGMLYSVGTWGDDLVSAAGWSTGSLGTCKALMDIGLTVSVDVGFFVDVFGNRGREWPAGLLAAALFGIGWFGLSYAMTSHSLAWLGAIAFFFIGHGDFCAWCAPLRANALNFGRRRKGTVDGFLLSSFGISAAIVGQVYESGFGLERVHSFLLGVGSIAVGVSLLHAVFTKRVPKVEELAELEADQLLEGSATEINVTPLEMFGRSAFWRLWFLVAFSGGANAFFVQSCGQLAALGVGGDISKSELVTAFSITNMVARFGGGVLADVLHNVFARSSKPRCGRILLCVPAALLMALTSLLVLTADSMTQDFATAAMVMGGLSEGLLFASWPGTVRDVFGSVNFTTNLSIVNIAFGVGAAVYLKVFGEEFLSKLKLAVGLCSVASVLAFSLFYSPRIFGPNSQLQSNSETRMAEVPQ